MILCIAPFVFVKVFVYCILPLLCIISHYASADGVPGGLLEMAWCPSDAISDCQVDGCPGPGVPVASRS